MFRDNFNKKKLNIYNIYLYIYIYILYLSIYVYTYIHIHTNIYLSIPSIYLYQENSMNSKVVQQQNINWFKAMQRFDASATESHLLQITYSMKYFTCFYQKNMYT